MSWLIDGTGNPDPDFIQTLAVTIGILAALAIVGIVAAIRHHTRQPRRGIHLFPEVSAPPDRLPPSAAIVSPEPRPPRWVNHGTPHLRDLHTRCPYGWCDGAITDDPLTDWDRPGDPQEADW